MPAEIADLDIAGKKMQPHVLVSFAAAVVDWIQDSTWFPSPQDKLRMHTIWKLIFGWVTGDMLPWPWELDSLQL